MKECLTDSAAISSLLTVRTTAVSARYLPGASYEGGRLYA